MDAQNEHKSSMDDMTAVFTCAKWLVRENAQLRAEIDQCRKTIPIVRPIDGSPPREQTSTSQQLSEFLYSLSTTVVGPACTFLRVPVNDPDLAKSIQQAIARKREDDQSRQALAEQVRRLQSERYVLREQLKTLRCSVGPNSELPVHGRIRNREGVARKHRHQRTVPCALSHPNQANDRKRRKLSALPVQ